jgi:MFS family permease
MGNISVYLGYIIPVSLLSEINKDIGPSNNITWVALAATLALSASFLILGRLSDIFGRRWFFIIGNALSLIGAIINATADRVNTLCGGQVFSGIAASVQLSFAIAVAELVPNKHRPAWVVAIFFSSFEIAVFGPVIGQKLVTNTAAGWRWSFYLNVITSALATILLMLFYHPPGFELLHRNRSKWEQLKRLDIIGLILFTSGLIVFIMGLSWGGTSYPWNSAHVIATLATSCVILSIFVIYGKFICRVLEPSMVTFYRNLFQDRRCATSCAPVREICLVFVAHISHEGAGSNVLGTLLWLLWGLWALACTTP